MHFTSQVGSRDILISVICDHNKPEARSCLRFYFTLLAKAFRSTCDCYLVYHRYFSRLIALIQDDGQLTCFSQKVSRIKQDMKKMQRLILKVRSNKTKILVSVSFTTLFKTINT